MEEITLEEALDVIRQLSEALNQSIELNEILLKKLEEITNQEMYSKLRLALDMGEILDNINKTIRKINKSRRPSILNYFVYDA